MSKFYYSLDEFLKHVPDQRRCEEVFGGVLCNRDPPCFPEGFKVTYCERCKEVSDVRSEVDGRS